MNNIISDIIDNMEQAIVGKRNSIELIVTCLLARGHVLLEDVPGVGKTQLALALAKSCDGRFNRLQLTPDIMPSDITGYTLIHQNTGIAEFVEGAAFCNFLLADEINRCSPKSQSALLEIMEEEQVSIDRNSYKLPNPFMVIATQNPVETYGTYHLPEAQLDRFLMKISVGYPSITDEMSIIRRSNRNAAAVLNSVVSLEDILQLQNSVNDIKVSKEIDEYILRILTETRNDDRIRLGVSPRGGMALRRCACAYALVRGRDYVIPDDIKYLAPFVLSHRVLLSSQGKAEAGSSEAVIANIMDSVMVVSE